MVALSLRPIGAIRLHDDPFAPAPRSGGPALPPRFESNAKWSWRYGASAGVDNVDKKQRLEPLSPLEPHVNPPFAAPSWDLVRACVARLRTRRGMLFAFGGGRDPAGRVRPAFMHYAGGDQARLAIIPVASWRLSTAEMYIDMLRQMGARDAWVVDPEGDQTDHPAVDDALGHASGIVITGGDQKRLARELGGTRALRSLERALDGGTPVYTTSAGTMALSDVMVGGLDDEGAVILQRGLGVLPGLTIETHVDTRQRHGRLTELVGRAETTLTIGIDENTAMVFEPACSRVHILGTGSVAVMAREGPAADAPRFGAGQSFDLADMVPALAKPAALSRSSAPPARAAADAERASKTVRARERAL